MVAVTQMTSGWNHHKIKTPTAAIKIAVFTVVVGAVVNNDLWCNGNTSGFGPGIQGSSPCRSNKE